MAGSRGPRGLLWLLAAVAGGTAVVVAATVALYPSDRPVSAAVPSSSAPAPTSSATAGVVTGEPSASAASAGTDAQGCPLALTAALDDHLLCAPDLGASWKPDTGTVVRPVSETCEPAGSAPVGPTGASRVLYLRGPGFDVIEQIRGYATVRDATTMFDTVRLWMLTCTSDATGLDVRDADNDIRPAALSAGFVGAQSWWVIHKRMRTGLVLFESGTRIVEVAVVPAGPASGPPQAALVSAVAHAALQWDTQPRASAKPTSSTD